MAYYKNKYGQLTSTYGLIGDDSDTGKDMQKAQMETEKEKERIRADAQRNSNASAERIEQMRIQGAADAVRHKEDMTPYGYVKGGPVVHVGYKHSNDPMYAKYSASMDSSLLAKNRKRT